MPVSWRSADLHRDRERDHIGNLGATQACKSAAYGTSLLNGIKVYCYPTGLVGCGSGGRLPYLKT